MTFEILPVVEADLAGLLELNESNVPHVNSIDRKQMAEFLGYANQFEKVVESGEVAGFVVALEAGAGYESMNYRWFVDHLSDFLYIDRIMVSPDFRRRGVASLLYQHLATQAQAAGLSSLCCEVNLVPPNPDSMRLHLGLGFAQRATQATEGGRKEVSLLVKPL